LIIPNLILPIKIFYGPGENSSSSIFIRVPFIRLKILWFEDHTLGPELVFGIEGMGSLLHPLTFSDHPCLLH
jgi:hypothetical protein